MTGINEEGSAKGIPLKPRWQAPTWVLILSLLFFFPLGAVLLWRYSDWTKSLKWIATAISFIIFAAALSSGGDDPAEVASSVKKTEPVATPIIESSPSPSPSPEPPPAPKSPEERIEAAMKKEFSGKSNNDRPKFQSIEINGTEETGFVVQVVFNADDNLTCRFRRRGIESDMRDAYQVLFTKFNVTRATMEALFPLIDKFGKEEDGTIYRTLMTREIASQINWENKASIDFRLLWETTFINHEFEEGKCAE